MPNIKSKWESTDKVPDEEFLKGQWKKELELEEKTEALAEESAKRKNESKSNKKLIEAAGLDERKHKKEDKERSRKALRDSAEILAKPSVDIEKVHKDELDLAKKNAGRLESPGNPHWQGFLFNASYGGWCSSWNGESEEVPHVSFDVGAKRFDPRVQAYGEGWYDSDYSRIDAYLAFTFRPPSWGRLIVRTYPWLHGFYNLYSDDTWYKSEYARAELDTWVQVHQNFWRYRQSYRRFTMGGYELHPTRYGRFDSSYYHYYSVDVGTTDTVTIRVGVNLYCRGKACGGRSILDFRSGAANFVYVPYIYWYLYQ
jgi:hypothetical protein